MLSLSLSLSLSLFSLAQFSSDLHKIWCEHPSGYPEDGGHKYDEGDLSKYSDTVLHDSLHEKENETYTEELTSQYR